MPVLTPPPLSSPPFYFYPSPLSFLNLALFEKSQTNHQCLLARRNCNVTAASYTLCLQSVRNTAVERGKANLERNSQTECHLFGRRDDDCQVWSWKSSLLLKSLFVSLLIWCNYNKYISIYCFKKHVLLHIQCCAKVLSNPHCFVFYLHGARLLIK